MQLAPSLPVEPDKNINVLRGGDMKQSVLLITLFMCGMSGEVCGQTEELVTRTFSTLQGLPSKRVSAIHQDSSGTLWVGTAAGLCFQRQGKYYAPDAANIWGAKTFAAVNSIAPGKSRRDFFVAGSHAAALAFLYRSSDRRREGLREFQVLSELDKGSQQSVEFLSVLETSQNEAFFGTRANGLWVRSSLIERKDDYFFRNNPPRQLLHTATVTALLEVAPRRLFIGTTQGLHQYVDTSIAPLPPILSSLRTASITKLHLDSNGVVWIGTKDRGAFRFDGRTLDSYNRQRGMPEDHITSITSTSTGDVWFGTGSRGIVRLRHHILSPFRGYAVLPSDSVLCVYTDQEDVVWVGTTEGLTKILPVTHRRYTAADGLPADGLTCGMQSRDGTLWFGGIGTIVRVDGTKPKLWRATGKIAGEQFERMIEDSVGGIWMSTGRSIVYFKDGVFARFQDSLFLRSVVADMVPAPEGGLFVLTHRVVKLLRGGLFTTVAEVGPTESLLSMVVDREGKLWIRSVYSVLRLTFGDTIVRDHYDGFSGIGDLMLSSDGSAVIFDHGYGFVSGGALTRGAAIPDAVLGGRTFLDLWRRHGWRFLTGFRSRDDSYYVTEIEGIWQQRSPSHNTPRRIVQMDMKQEEQVLELSNGDHLLLGIDGFYFFHPRWSSVSIQPLLNELILPELFKEQTIRAEPFSVAELVKRRRLIHEGPDGALWVGSRGGIQVLNVHSATRWMPRPLITEISAGDVVFGPSRSDFWGRGVLTLSVPRQWFGRRSNIVGGLDGFTQKDHLILPSQSNDLEFRFHFPTNRSEFGVVYQYRLDGVDTAWSAFKVGESARFLNVPQGTYTFRVRAVGADRRFSEEQKVDISVIVPFWKETWFWTLTALTLVYSSGRWYVRRVRELREEHARMTKQAIQESEFKMARTLQLGMLPERCPEIPGYLLAARSLPASDVGGDFYDFLYVGQDQLGIAVGDVSGHGITGAMIVGMARTSLRFASANEDAPARVLSVANERLRQDIRKNIFVAMFYGILDPATARLRYICAGQPLPILVRDGEAREIPKNRGDRFPLGILPGVRYAEEDLKLQPGDAVVFYTDGVVEAVNAQKEEFGFDRLRQFLARHAHLTAEELIEALVKEVRTFANRVDQNDDITVVVLQRRKEDPA